MVLGILADQGTLVVPGILDEVGSWVVADALDELDALVEVGALEVEDALAEVDALEEVLGEVEELKQAFHYCPLEPLPSLLDTNNTC